MRVFARGSASRTRGIARNTTTMRRGKMVLGRRCSRGCLSGGHDDFFGGGEGAVEGCCEACGGMGDDGAEIGGVGAL